MFTSNSPTKSILIPANEALINSKLVSFCAFTLHIASNNNDIKSFELLIKISMKPLCDGLIEIVESGRIESMTSVYLLSINACFKISIFADSVYSVIIFCLSPF